MKLAPIDISHKSFKRRTFGSDTDEVGEFLKLVADEFESLIREKNRLRDDLREKDLELIEYKERDKVLRDTIATAHRMSEKVREDAEREAKIILNDASQKAEMIVRDARDSLKRVYQEITEINRAKIQFESNLKALVQSHLSLLDANRTNSALPQMPEKLNLENQVKRFVEPQRVEASASNVNSGSNTSLRVSPLSSD